MQVNNQAYNDRKEKWFKRNPDKRIFEPTLEEIRRDAILDEWFFYFVNRVATSPHQRHYETLAVGGTDEEAILEKEKTELEILQDYEGWQDYDKVQQVWTE